MARHGEIIISGEDLQAAFGSYDCGDVEMALGEEHYDTIDWRGFWLVSWPEHVISPRFNCDANFVRVGDTFAEASRDFPQAKPYSVHY